MRSYFGAGLRYSLFIILLADATAALIVAIGVIVGRSAQPPGGVSMGPLLMHALPLAAALVGVVAISGFYEPRAWLKARTLAGCAALAVAVMLVGSYALAEVFPFRMRPMHVVWTICVAYVMAVVAFRLGLVAALRSRIVPVGVEQIASGSGPDLDEFNVAQRPGPRFTPQAAGPTLLAATALRSRRDPRTVQRDNAPERPAAAVASPSARRGMPLIRAKETRSRRVDLDTLPNDWIAASPVVREGWASRTLRRTFDIVGSLALLLAVLPVLLITALAIRLESRGPVLYRQERVGKDGKVFTLFKFRSMTVDAEKGGPCWALPRDPRVTRVGRIIRLTRIDEVPQIFNVLRGEMALIGPRPERPPFVEQLAAVIPHYRSRSAVRPGITGWAQVNYPYGASVEDARNKLAFDLYYIQHRTLALDASIVVGTIRVVIFQEGAR